jgi:hypothetical protein
LSDEAPKKIATLKTISSKPSLEVPVPERKAATPRKPIVKSVKKASEKKEEAPTPKLIDTTLQASTKIQKMKARTEKPVRPIFAHASEKEKKCFALGGVLSDLSNNLKLQTYALAGTGFNPDGTPVRRERGDNWEEQYSQLLMYLATAEALGCTYQGNFASLLGARSQTQASAGLLDDLTTDLRKMTLGAVAFGPRHNARLTEIDREIEKLALKVQLAEMEWNMGGYDEMKRKWDKYRLLNDDSKKELEAIQKKYETTGKTLKGLSADERNKLFYPPTETQVENLRRLIGIRGGEAGGGEKDNIDRLIDERNQILATPILKSEVPLKKMADKAVRGIDEVDKEIFGNLEDEKGALMSLLSQAFRLYAEGADDERGKEKEGFKAIVGADEKDYTKLLDILSRLRMAREASEYQTNMAYYKQKMARAPPTSIGRKDVFNEMVREAKDAVSNETWNTFFDMTQRQLALETSQAEGDPDKIAKVNKLTNFLASLREVTAAPPLAELSIQVPKVEEKEIKRAKKATIVATEELPEEEFVETITEIPTPEEKKVEEILPPPEEKEPEVPKAGPKKIARLKK